MTDFPLPDDLPVPTDDGACDHLPDHALPNITLTATNGEQVNLSTRNGRTVIYIYPMTGRPGVDLPQGWNEIPGARGCTPQSCAFRDHYAELQTLHASVFGLSTQDTAYQQEAAERLHLPYALLSDHTWEWAKALNLPTFEAEAQSYLQRTTLIVDDGKITHVFYPVFPPNKNADDVLAWLKANPVG